MCVATQPPTIEWCPGTARTLRSTRYPPPPTPIYGGCHPYARKSASYAVISINRMQLTLLATRRAPHGASRMVPAMSAWSVKNRRAPCRHYRDARVDGRTTTAMHDNEYTPPVLLPLLFQCWCGAAGTDISVNGLGVCDFACSGDPGETCGGFFAFNAYEYIDGGSPTTMVDVGCYVDSKEARIMTLQTSSGDMTPEV